MSRSSGGFSGQRREEELIQMSVQRRFGAINAVSRRWRSTWGWAPCVCVCRYTQYLRSSPLFWNITSWNIFSFPLSLAVSEFCGVSGTFTHTHRRVSLSCIKAGSFRFCLIRLVSFALIRLFKHVYSTTERISTSVCGVKLISTHFDQCFFSLVSFCARVLLCKIVQIWETFI